MLGTTKDVDFKLCISRILKIDSEAWKKTLGATRLLIAPGGIVFQFSLCWASLGVLVPPVPDRLSFMLVFLTPRRVYEYHVTFPVKIVVKSHYEFCLACH